MNKYYFDFIVQKLKKDINDTLVTDENRDNTDIILKEIELYFQINKITFNEVNVSSGTHQVRNRSAYVDKINRCKAVVWNEGYGGQCSRTSKVECSGFCKTHLKKGGNDWWLGTVGHRVERPVDGNGKIHNWIETN